MEKRLLIYLPIAFAIYFAAVIYDHNRQAANLPPQPDVKAPKDAGKKAGDKGAADKAAADKAAGDKGAGDKAAGDNGAKVGNAEAPPANAADNKNPGGAKAGVPAEEAKPIPEQWFTLGSIAPASAISPYEMLVTLTSRGAAVERVELSDPRYLDLDPDRRFGYLGQLALVSDKELKGCRVQVVGDGTPAAAAGLKADDVILELNTTKPSASAPEVNKTPTPERLFEVLKSTDSGETVTLKVSRGGAPQKLTVTLGRRPMEVIRPELDTDPINQSAEGGHDPLSFLMTLREADDDEIPADAINKLEAEIPGLHLRNGNWEGKMVGPSAVEFTRTLPKWHLTVVKRYRLAKVPADQFGKADAKAYHLVLDVEIQNTDTKVHSLAYQLDGPTGLPTEGWWYASRVSHGLGAVALRDMAIKLQGNGVTLVSSLPIAQQEYDAAEAKKAGKEPPKKDDSVLSIQKESEQMPLTFVGVDAQYFAAILLPQHTEKTFAPWLADIRPVIVGEIPADVMLRQKVDATCRLTSVVSKLDPGQSLAHHYEVFVGPKLPALLEQYAAPTNPTENLSGLVYYGWFSWVAEPMVFVLELFHGLARNYGLAIIMLTVLVRLCMFPLSRKQAISAKKMQDLAPEMKKIKEKFKDKPQDQSRATQELWRKNNVNPLGGCLLVFVQLPIFVGLRNVLVVDVNLRQSSLFGDAINWCSNLAAPDMLWHWKDVLPSFLTSETGRLLIFPAPGPWLNVLPIITVAIFLWQQSMFMPPSTDDQSAMQQKLMKWMTILMGFAFFKVAAGLCLYFMASSLWGIGERKLLPKMAANAVAGGGGSGSSGSSGGSGGTGGRPAPTSGSNGSGGAKRRKQRGRK